MRIFIGGISSELSKCLDDFEQRLGKYGTIKTSIQTHFKPIGETGFGFVDMDINDEQFGLLKQRYNNVKFKGSILSIAPAKPDFVQRWKQDQERGDPEPNRDQLKRMYSVATRDEGVILGRERKSKRDWKRVTIRLKKKGDKKSVIVKCKKTKLWGYQKDKSLKGLVFEYLRGKWLDGMGDIVEVIEKEGISDNASEEVTQSDERSRNMKLLQEMFGGDNNDWEVDSLKNDDEVIELGDEDKSENGRNLVQWESSDSSEESGTSDNENVNDKQSEPDTDDAEVVNGERSSEMELDENLPVKIFPANNTTESLRELFDNQSQNFSLFSYPEDEENDDSTESIAKLESLSRPPRVVTVVPSSHIGLFFPHYESPFLNSQAQVSKLKTSSFDQEKWKDHFYEKRGEWNREFKRRRRDVLRQLRKKNVAKGKLF